MSPLESQGPLPPDWPFDPRTELRNGHQFPEPAGEPGPNMGELTIEVWPPYIGLSVGDPGPGPLAAGEPCGDISYSRGQIMWRTLPDGNVVGAARICAPKGVYTHLVFFSGPARVHPMMGEPKAMEFPVVFDRPGFIDVDPIGNADYLPRISS